MQKECRRGRMGQKDRKSAEGPQKVQKALSREPWRVRSAALTVRCPRRPATRPACRGGSVASPAGRGNRAGLSPDKVRGLSMPPPATPAAVPGMLSGPGCFSVFGCMIIAGQAGKQSRRYPCPVTSCRTSAGVNN